jgi:hypothetical protein
MTAPAQQRVHLQHVTRISPRQHTAFSDLPHRRVIIHQHHRPSKHMGKLHIQVLIQCNAATGSTAGCRSAPRDMQRTSRTHRYTAQSGAPAHSRPRTRDLGIWEGWDRGREEGGIYGAGVCERCGDFGRCVDIHKLPSSPLASHPPGPLQPLCSYLAIITRTRIRRPREILPTLPTPIPIDRVVRESTAQTLRSTRACSVRLGRTKSERSLL